MIACAPLVASETIFLTDYSTNYLTASQQSPFDDTVFTTSGSPPGGARLSIVNSAHAPNVICPTDSSSVFDSTYNPYTVVAGMTTPDGYPLGDLQDRCLCDQNKRLNNHEPHSYPLPPTLSLTPSLTSPRHPLIPTSPQKEKRGRGRPRLSEEEKTRRKELRELGLMKRSKRRTKERCVHTAAWD